MPDDLKTYEIEDADGNVINAVPVSAVDELKKQLEEKDASIKALNEKIEKDIPKGESFRALDKKVQKTEAEKSELESRLEALEKQRVADLENNKKSLEIKLENAFLAQANGDKDLADKIKFYYNRFAGDTNSDDEINQRISEATFLAKRRVDQGNPITRAVAASGGSSYIPNTGNSEDFSRTPEGLEFAKKLGLKFTQNNK